ncbi:hypothetical protein GCM10009535_57780 [Streptomyces thermocarboxydovorans]|uniref:Uncharacterized protein n=2 Tax=Streptomyces thermocarboxydovorans TaxID=59298 RepID=A0ABN1HW66_9ACTN
MPARIRPWEEWMDGEVHTIHRGMDFQKEPVEMAKSIRFHARYHDMKAKARVEGDSVIFQFLHEEE